MKNRLLPYFFLVLGLTAWGLEAVLRKPIIADISPYLSTLITSAGIFIVAYLVSLKEKIDYIKELKTHFWILILAVVLGIGGFVAFFVALGRLDASVAGFVKMMEPLVVLALGYFTLGERLEKRTIPFMVLAFVGMLLVSSKGGNWQNLQLDWQGVGLLGLVSFFWGSVMVVAKVAMNRGISPSAYTTLRFALQTFFLLPILLFPSLSWVGESPGGSPLWIITYTTGLTAIGFLGYYMGLQKIKAMQVAMVEFLSPVIMLVLSFMILGERFSALQWFGGGIIFVSLYFVLGFDRERRKANEREK